MGLLRLSFLVLAAVFLVGCTQTLDSKVPSIRGGGVGIDGVDAPAGGGSPTAEDGGAASEISSETDTSDGLGQAGSGAEFASSGGNGEGVSGTGFDDEFKKFREQLRRLPSCTNAKGETLIGGEILRSRQTDYSRQATPCSATLHSVALEDLEIGRFGAIGYRGRLYERKQSHQTLVMTSDEYRQAWCFWDSGATHGEFFLSTNRGRNGFRATFVVKSGSTVTYVGPLAATRTDSPDKRVYEARGKFSVTLSLKVGAPTVQAKILATYADQTIDTTAECVTAD